MLSFLPFRHTGQAPLTPRHIGGRRGFSQVAAAWTRQVAEETFRARWLKAP